MHLFLVRHGHAVDVQSSGLGSDAKRVLSDKGLVRTRQAARGFAVLETPVSRIVSSPLIRARQTAEIFAEELGYTGRMIIREELEPGADPSALLPWLRGLTERPTMLVGHMPNVAVLSGLLVCGSDVTDFRFKKTSVCCLSIDRGLLPGTACVDSFIPPSVLRRLAV
ncbi:MAG: histidine phosphatase family protein [Kiritimatiellia bacterium]|nr:histidine phosphatase family protein [Kiritimatiellia bacterium]MDP6848646.1 histidine phosphatase family protein [Kiritimatiellia bacterium]